MMRSLFDAPKRRRCESQPATAGPSSKSGQKKWYFRTLCKTRCTHAAHAQRACAVSRLLVTLIIQNQQRRRTDRRNLAIGRRQFCVVSVLTHANRDGGSVLRSCGAHSTPHLQPCQWACENGVMTSYIFCLRAERKIQLFTRHGPVCSGTGARSRPRPPAACASAAAAAAAAAAAPVAAAAAAAALRRAPPSSGRLALPCRPPLPPWPPPQRASSPPPPPRGLRRSFHRRRRRRSRLRLARLELGRLACPLGRFVREERLAGPHAVGDGLNGVYAALGAARTGQPSCTNAARPHAAGAPRQFQRL